jgi:hypothetical protein
MREPVTVRAVCCACSPPPRTPESADETPHALLPVRLLARTIRSVFTTATPPPDAKEIDCAVRFRLTWLDATALLMRCTARGRVALSPRLTYIPPPTPSVAVAPEAVSEFDATVQSRRVMFLDPPTVTLTPPPSDWWKVDTRLPTTSSRHA